MSEAWAALVSGGGVAGVWVLSMLFDFCFPRSYVRLLERQMAEKDLIIATERKRADIAVAVAEAGRDAFLGAIRGGASAVQAVAQEAAAGSAGPVGHNS